MATIQVRDVPDDVHRVYQQRATLAGMSLQEYLRAELTRNALTRTPAELVAETEQRLAAEGPAGFAAVSSASLLRADREAPALSGRHRRPVCPRSGGACSARP